MRLRRTEPGDIPLKVAGGVPGLVATLALGACGLETIVAPEEAMHSAPMATDARNVETASSKDAAEPGQESAEAPQTAGNGAPEGSSEVFVSGTACVGPTALPLIIIDGVRSKASFDDIAALELESFEIVKGSHAVEDYGEDGRNGAILIFTKQSDGDGKDGGTPEEPPN